MLAPIDLIAFGKLILDSQEWLKGILSKREDQREQFCAHILYEAGVSVVSIRALEDATRKLASSLVRLDSSWTLRQRTTLFDEINDFIQRKPIVSKLRVSISAMQTYLEEIDQLEKPFRDSVAGDLRLVWSFSKAVLDAVDGGYGLDQDLFIADEVADFWHALKDAKDEHEISEAAAIAQRAFDRLPHLAAMSELHFGYLKGIILTKYPTIPEPPWV
jgi:hypothetical protein